MPACRHSPQPGLYQHHIATATNTTPTIVQRTAVTTSETFQHTKVHSRVRNVKGRPLQVAVLALLMILSLVISPCLGLPLRRHPSSKNLTPFSVECREVLLCWVVQIQTHALQCGDDDNRYRPEHLGGACDRERQRLVGEHASVLSAELGLEVHHTFGQFHDHLMLCLNLSPPPNRRSTEPLQTGVNGKATSLGISHLHKMHSDLRVKAKQLFDFWRRNIEVKMAEHPEVLTFSSEHVHRRKSRLEIPPRISAQQAYISPSAPPPQNLQSSDLSPLYAKVSSQSNGQGLSWLSSNSVSGLPVEQTRSVLTVSTNGLSPGGAAETKSSSSRLPLPVPNTQKSFMSLLVEFLGGLTRNPSPSVASLPYLSLPVPQSGVLLKENKPSTKLSPFVSKLRSTLDSLDGAVNISKPLSTADVNFPAVSPAEENLSGFTSGTLRHLSNHQTSPYHLHQALVARPLSRHSLRHINTQTRPHRRPLGLWLLKGPQKRALGSTSRVRSLKNFEKLHPTDTPYVPPTTPGLGIDHVERFFFQQVPEHPRFRRRTRRDTVTLLPPVAFNDPAYPRQWHLYNRATPGMDINVTGVWGHNITGHGVTVAVVDDGVEWRNPDLKANYNYKGSWDLNDDDPDPSPSYSKTSNHHGTRCAGEIAAVANNNVCGVGVAYGANIAGVRVLDGVMTDSMEAEAFNKNMDINSIFSCSWGPDDDGTTVDGPHLMAAKAMKFGVDFGRGGFGSVFVVASGNGGENGDNCNYDGYANSIYTVTIGAVDENGGMPYYAEECASMLGVTFSSGTLNKRDIVTTDWQPSMFGETGSSAGDSAGGFLGWGGPGGQGASGRGGVAARGGVFRGASSIAGDGDLGGCTERHTGTSAAAPLAAGMIALMLEARPCLTWRDVQYVVALTARKVDVEVAHWQNNGAGLAHSHKHGFGLLSAWRLVNAARVWKTVPWLTSYSCTEESSDWNIPKGHRNPLTIAHSVTPRDIQGLSLFIVEHVQLTVWLSHPWRGKIEVKVVSPAGTVSTLAATRHKDNSSNGFTDWTFTTVRCWGETPTGEWTILVADHDEHAQFGEGQLSKYRLTLFGTPMTPEEFQERRRTVEAAMTGEFLRSNYNLNCPPPPKYQSVYAPVSERVLKIIILSGIFLIVMAVYETFEYIFCYDDEKKETRESRRAALRTARMAQEAVTVEDEECFEQTAALLAQQPSEDTDPPSMGNSNSPAHIFSSRNQASNSVAVNEEEDEDGDDFLSSSETSRLLGEEQREITENQRDIWRGANLLRWGGKGVCRGQINSGLSPLRDVIPLQTFSTGEVERSGEEVAKEEVNTADAIGVNGQISDNCVKSTSSSSGHWDRSAAATRSSTVDLSTTRHLSQNSLSSNGHVLSS